MISLVAAIFAFFASEILSNPDLFLAG